MSVGAGASRAARGGRARAASSAVGKRPALDVERILRWADAHRTATGRWPDWRSGPVGGADDETWSAIDAALRRGRRGLPGGSSLARLLAEERGVAAGDADLEAPAERMRAWEAEQFPTRRPKRLRAARPRATTLLTIELILAWVDAHHAATGQWPRVNSGEVRDHPGLNWMQVNRALSEGRRGLKGGSSLADLLQEHRGVRNKQNLPRLDVEQVLAWADAHREATGEYPHSRSGPVLGVPGETWAIIHSALSKGLRGLPASSSLAQLLAERRGYRGPLTVERILAWADAHHAATGRWPTSWSSGAVRGEPGETWPSLDAGLRDGRRGLPGGTTLAQLLAEHRGAPNIYTEPPLTAEQILRLGRRPPRRHRPLAVAAVRRGAPRRGRALGLDRHGPARGLSRPAGRAVARPPDPRARRAGRVSDPPRADGRADPGLGRRAPRGHRRMARRGLRAGPLGPRGELGCDQRRPGPGRSRPARRLVAGPPAGRAPRRPQREGPPAPDGRADPGVGRRPPRRHRPLAVGLLRPGGRGVGGDLGDRQHGPVHGHRGLPGGSSLARLLAKHRPVRPRRLFLRKIRSWARAHREATGRWPDAHAGPVRGVPDENWSAIDAALKFGRRGLPGGSSLTALFDRSLDPAARGIRPDLTVEQVLAWADAHRAATGRWPTITSGPIAGVPGEKWVNLDAALRLGRRGLPRGTNLTRLIAEHRDTPAAPAAATRSRGGPDVPAAGGAASRA